MPAASSDVPTQLAHFEILRKRIAELVEENEELKRDKRSFRDASDQLRRDLDKARRENEKLKKKHKDKVLILETRVKLMDEEMDGLKRKGVELEVRRATIICAVLYLTISLREP